MRHDIEKIPVTLLSGFLGSGKTTLLNRLLRAPALARTAVIINEFGQIGIDRSLLELVPGEVVQLDSGCLCCGLLNGFRETLASLIERRARGEIPAFERVLVETTGLADPAPLLQTLLKDGLLRPHFILSGLTTVVDAAFGERTLLEHREARVQVALADRLIVTKTDLTADRCPERLAARLHRLNAHAPWTVAGPDGLDPAAVLGGGSAAASAALPGLHALPEGDGVGESGLRHDPAIVSEAFVLERPATWSGVAAWMDVVREFFGERMLRCKGLLEVESAGGPVLIQGVRNVFAPPLPLRAWPDADRRSRLVGISSGLEPGLLRLSLGLLHAEPGTFRPATLADLRRDYSPPRGSAAGMRGLP
jgi:G3E family GTPase